MTHPVKTTTSSNHEVRFPPDKVFPRELQLHGHMGAQGGKEGGYVKGGCLWYVVWGRGDS